MNITIVSDNNECHGLANVLDFIGVTTDIIFDINHIDVTTDAIIIDVKSNDFLMNAVDCIASRFIKMPVVVFDVNSEISGFKSKNIIGYLSEPLNQRMIFSMIDNIKCYHRVEEEVIDKKFIGKSDLARKVKININKAANSICNVMISGESGVGKEIIARMIHNLSRCAGGPFVPINCSAIPRELLESELFGHEKGAFTGAVSTYKGRFEHAQGGTLFLDEIGDMPMDMQVKLLRVLQEKEFQRIGGSKAVKTNAKIICATHRNLDEMINDNSFRLDLFHRLNVFPIDVPNLHSRHDDIHDLIRFLKKKITERGYCNFDFSESAIKCLETYTWPGNVRELENLVERLAISYPGRIVEPSDLPDKYRQHIPPEVHVESENTYMSNCNNDLVKKNNNNSHYDLFSTSKSFNLKETLASVEANVISSALIMNGRNVAKTARFLKTQRTTLIEKIRKYKIII